MRRLALSCLALLSVGCSGSAPLTAPDTFVAADAFFAVDAAPSDAGPSAPDWVSAGGIASCASRSGRVWCWGTLWTTRLEPRPIVIPELAGASQIAITYEHACAILGDGRVTCAGSNRAGQLGVSPSALDRRDAFEPVVGVAHAVEIVVGSGFACARIVDGSVLCWGDDSAGQTGSPIPAHAGGASAPQFTPAPVEGIAGAIALSAGEYTACAVLTTGLVRCWGYDWFGALGRGARYTGQPQSVADDVEGVTDAIDVASYGTFSCALRRSGGVACWGGLFAQVPGVDFATDDECEVVVSQDCWRGARPLPGIEAAISLGIGSEALCVRSIDAWQCWGSSLAGTTPARVHELSVGARHVCVRDAEGIACRGRGDDGELGDGLDASSSALVRPLLP